MTISRRTRKRLWVAAGICAALLVLTAAARLPAAFRTDEETATLTYRVEPRSFTVVLEEKGELRAKNSIDIKSEVDGENRIIYLIPEGSRVQKGDLLVELASDRIEEKLHNQRIKVSSTKAAWEAAQAEYEIQLDQNASDIRKAELKLELARLKLEKFKQGDWKVTLREKELAVERARKVLDRRRKDLANSRRLRDKEYITQVEYEQAEFDAYVAQVELEMAELRLRMAQEYDYKTQLAQLESDVEEAAKELERVRKNARAQESRKKAEMEAKETEYRYAVQELQKLEDQLAKTKIYAPAPGFVVYYNERWWDESNRISEGSVVRKQQTILTLPDPSVMIVEVRIHEAKTDRVAVGQDCLVEVEGVKGQVFHGKVTRIAMLADSQNRWLNPHLKEYETEITLDPTEVPLKPGATAKVQIIVRELNDVLAVPVQSVFTRAGRSYVFIRNGSDEPEPREVRLGLSNADFVEVREGLEPGTEIYLAIDDQMQQRLPALTEEPFPGRLAEPPPASADGDLAARTNDRSRNRTPKSSETNGAARG